MKQNKLPLNKLDIITPVLSYQLHLDRYAEAYRELIGIEKSEFEGKQNTHLYPITAKTPFPARQATEIIGGYFNREWGSGGPPYQAHEHEDERDRIFVLTRKKDGETEYAIGAIIFRWRNYSDAPGELVLNWVWIHPFLRRQGILTAYWGLFRRLYGNFFVEPPLSPAMESFLKKVREL